MTNDGSGIGFVLMSNESLTACCIVMLRNEASVYNSGEYRFFPPGSCVRKTSGSTMHRVGEIIHLPDKWLPFLAQFSFNAMQYIGKINNKWRMLRIFT